MNRGSPSVPARSDPHPCGFNEAPIHESGKCSHPKNSEPQKRRFNEAPIHESGKYDRFDAKILGVSRASMRPRFMNRGSMLGVGLGCPSINCFNEAPIHESGKLDRHLCGEASIAGFNEAPIHESGKSVRALRRDFA